MSAYTKLLAGFLLIYPITCHAQGLNFMGKPTPAGIGLPQSPVTLTNWDNGTLPGLSGKTAARILATPILGDVGLNTRGQQDITIYQNASPSVVMVVTDDSLGSGSYLGSNLILTNAHVVGTKSYAGIVFKPQQEGAKINPSSIVIGNVSRIDRLRDLAVLRVNSVPTYVHPLELGNSSEIKVGADVYAIGHPTGEAWTFTRGLISQIRKDYDWKDETGIHRADVIQTQTPINVGNSGGPLISDTGKLLGVNSFKTAQTEGINFAISVEDVIGLLKPSNKPAIQNKNLPCKPVRLYDGRNKENNGRVVLIDTNCHHAADVALITPDDVNQPIQALIESKYDGKIDIIVDDFNRDGLWDVSFYDTQHDGTIDLVGFHPDGKIKASYYEKYNPSETYSNYISKNN